MLRSETAASPARRECALAGLAAYQAAPRAALPPSRPVVAAAGRAVLRDHGGTGRPVLFVPSLINPPNVLDLGPDRSLLRWLSGRGMRTLLVDWGTPTTADASLDLAGHVERILLPLIASLPEPPVLVGYCLGGTLALAAAHRAAAVATIAAPWHFAGYGPAARAEVAHLWRLARPAADSLGTVPMEVLQAGFWQLDPARTVAKYEAFAAMPPASAQAEAFVRLEDWANGGAPIPFAAGADLFDRLFAADGTGAGRWRVDGHAVDPLALPCPAIEFVSLTDRIVPAATAIGLRDRRDVAAGHVGMVVGSRAREQLWEPLARWIAALHT